MYFNRHKAYNMARAYAKKNGFEYDWFVNARLDCGWVSPTEPLAHFSNDRIWVPATWQEYVPDTFALVPEKFADVYFSLPYHMEQDGSVFCLGGPDFDPQTCNFSHLENVLHLNRTHAKHVTSVCCSHSGHSEKILQELLKKHGVHAEAAPFHTFIARDSRIEEYCGSFDPGFSWKLINERNAFELPYYDYIAEHNLSYFVRSIAPLRGCEEIGRKCKITTETSTVPTPDGPIAVQHVKHFTCPRPDHGSNRCTLPRAEQLHDNSLIAVWSPQCLCGFSSMWTGRRA